jgi:ABC-2 type transport system permease protein
MTFILVRKLLRDVRPALVVVCVLLFIFAALWVKITQRVTTEIVPMARLISQRSFGNDEFLETLFVRGPSKVSQAALGWGEMSFNRPNDFLAIGMLHPVVLMLSIVWGIGRAAGAVAGELDRGTMELLMSQPIPRNRLILAHFVVDCLVVPIICLSFFAGTQFGLWAVGDFVPDYTMLDETTKNAKLKGPGGKPIPAKVLESLLPPEKRDTTPLEVSGMGELPALTNTFALIFALSGMTLAISAAGRSLW